MINPAQSHFFLWQRLIGGSSNPNDPKPNFTPFRITLFMGIIVGVWMVRSGPNSSEMLAWMVTFVMSFGCATIVQLFFETLR